MLSRAAGCSYPLPSLLVVYSRADIERVSPWVGPRPRHLGGFWALGCRVCAVAMKHPEFAARRRLHIVANQKHGFCKQAISRTGKWSHYQVRVCGTPRDLRHRLQAHACSDSHRLCADLVNSPRFLLGPAAPLRRGCSDAELACRAKDAREAACSNADSSGKPAASSGQPAASSGQPAASSGQLAP